MAADCTRLATKPRSSDHNRLTNGEWRPITGWPLAAIGRLAEASSLPTLLTFTCQAKPLWRQSVFLALAMSATALAGEQTLRNWVREWLHKADQLAIPFDETDLFRPATDVEAMIDIGKRFKNCVGTHCVAAAIAGKLAVLEYLPEPALVVVCPLDGEHWLVGGVHTRQNKKVDAGLRQRVMDALKQTSDNLRFPVEQDADECQILGRHLQWFDPVTFDLELPWQ